MRMNPFTRTLVTILVLSLATVQLAGAQSFAAQQQPLQNQSAIPQKLNPNATPVEPDQPAATDGQKNGDQKPDEALPNAPSAQQPAIKMTNTAQTANKPKQTPQPLGTAAAEKATTLGGGASRPAGTAIAPAKQRQVRSLLIKLGAIAAGGIALGAVYGLSKRSPSTPSNGVLVAPAK